ncbi:MAG: phosphopantetheine-binding protein [Acidimicrobiales bacterium]
MTLSPESHMQNMWQGVLAQFLVESTKDRKARGVVAAYGADFRNARCSIALVSHPSEEPAPQIEGMRLFIDYLFAVFPFQKLTASVVEFNWPQLAFGLDRMLTEEGVLRNHEYHDGEYWDVRMVAVFRDQWQSYYAKSASRRLDIETENSTTFETFAFELASTFGWRVDELGPGTRLQQDLGCDSIAMLELIAIVDQFASKEINESAFANIETLGELYRLFSLFAFDQ